MSFYSSFATYYESIFPFSQAVHAFLRRTLPSPPATVLDIGCGTGHYAGALAKDGFDVTGIDLDPAMIAYARKHYPAATFHTLDMRAITTLGGAFAAAFCIGNTAAHLPHTAFARFLDDVRKAVKPGGAWVLQVMNWDYVLTQTTVALPLLTASDASDGERNAVVFERAYHDISAERVTFHTRLLVGGVEIFTDATPLYPLPSAEIIALHTARGFRLTAHQGSYGGAPFDPTQFSANIFAFTRE
jgi:SAM-dependent methyltransferase